eukprot:Blabericola_migrator_1__9062@NODE_4828_length_963_cov_506_090402_g3014_i0_p1_GENE_NODE_4828_length_963_cov_506_090402_g3014_i0NODE_4828_length_963_cov_506_090402_g3014_i0_p1_ORF_typecomplete_len203_score34_91Pro_isomerase/PF00160_21/3_9e48_NODE_4828_length_963_cov_506_090402_g3014_i013621
MLFRIFAGLLVVASASGDHGKITNVVRMNIQHTNTSGETKDLGIIELGLFNEDLPRTTESFEWACTNHYAGSIFHRIIPDFMAQGGDFTNHDGTGGESKYGETFDDEGFQYKHQKYTLSMANRGPNTNGSQFFVTFRPTSWLDGRHVVFGCATKGADTLSAMEALGSSSGRVKGKITIQSCSVRGANSEDKCLSSKSHGEEM